MIPETSEIRTLMSDGKPRTARDIAEAFGAEPTKACLDRITTRLRSLERYGLVHIDAPRRQGSGGYLSSIWSVEKGGME